MPVLAYAESAALTGPHRTTRPKDGAAEDVEASGTYALAEHVLGPAASADGWPDPHMEPSFERFKPFDSTPTP
jgi:hypothetical protein